MTSGWHGTLDAFMGTTEGTTEAEWLSRAAWLRGGLPDALAQIPLSRGWEVFLDLAVPAGRGPGPDAVIRAGNYLLVLVRVAASQPSQALLDRAMACSRELRRQHPEARKLSALPVLVLTETDMRPILHEGVCVTSAGKLYGLFKMLGLEATRPAADPGSWLGAAATAAEGGFARDLEAWTAEVLEGHFPSASLIATMARDEGLDAYLTRNHEAAAAYVKARFDRAAGAASGFPVVEWGLDLVWDGQRWSGGTSPAEPQTGSVSDSLSSYRSHLMCGRDGLIVVVPPVAPLDPTYGVLASSGLVLLPEA